MEDVETLMTFEEIAQRWRLPNERSVRKFLRKHNVPITRLGDRTPRVRPAFLSDLLDDVTTPWPRSTL